MLPRPLSLITQSFSLKNLSSPTNALSPDIQIIESSRKNIYKSKEDQVRAKLTEYKNNLLSKLVNIKSYSFLDCKHDSELDNSDILLLEISNDHC
ncbi:2104_t:CDS:2 [Acaulospora morrowiae]|uniref:2104_t:CDS:1 n=1 Tax=Acaulospora morrowiae TaxID=94023 RepID=A0A9N9APP0_9GLOM|nr:2104_t:CDS:2 [Acaulospora morrowiae]